MGSRAGRAGFPRRRERTGGRDEKPKASRGWVVYQGRNELARGFNLGCLSVARGWVGPDLARRAAGKETFFYLGSFRSPGGRAHPLDLTKPDAITLAPPRRPHVTGPTWQPQ